MFLQDKHQNIHLIFEKQLLYINLKYFFEIMFIVPLSSAMSDNIAIFGEGLNTQTNKRVYWKTIESLPMIISFNLFFWKI